MTEPTPTLGPSLTACARFLRGAVRESAVVLEQAEGLLLDEGFTPVLGNKVALEGYGAHRDNPNQWLQTSYGRLVGAGKGKSVREVVALEVHLDPLAPFSVPLFVVGYARFRSALPREQAWSEYQWWFQHYLESVPGDLPRQGPVTVAHERFFDSAERLHVAAEDLVRLEDDSDLRRAVIDRVRAWQNDGRGS